MKRIAESGCLVGLALAGTLVGLTGCKVGPNYKAPQTAAPASWTSAMSGGLSKAAADTNVLARWWTVFKDPTLSELIERARAGNLDLKQAEARVREARAQRGIAKAALFPTVGANASASRSTSGNESVNGVTGNLGTGATGNVGSGGTSDLYAAGFDASWELDLFGGKRRSLEAATASWQASVESMNDVMVSLLAEVALNDAERDLRHHAVATRGGVDDATG
jgi:outer membrane protein TolC